MKKLLFLVGTRPEVIKIAPLFRVLRQNSTLSSLLCTSGQHDSLLTDTLLCEGLTPDISFSITGDLTEKTAKCLTAFDRILSEYAPDAVIVHGDTLTAFSGAVAAFHRRIPVLHVEAGLRTGDTHSPFPEELYRRAIDALSSLHLAPTDLAAQNLLREGIPSSRIHTVGNTAIDSLLADLDPSFTHPLLQSQKKLVILTVHRRESQGEPLRSILRGVRAGIYGRTDCHLFFPMHPSPCIRAAALPVFSSLENVTLSPPIDAHTFRNLLANAALVLTDSGGVSEECTALGIPTLLLRNETERTEGIDAGVLHSVGTETEAIKSAVCDFLDTPRKPSPSDAFGDGFASVRIARAIENFLKS